MFTGIIEEIGIIRSIQTIGSALIVEYEASLVLEGTRIGDSIAVNGVCQTVRKMSRNGFVTDISGETIGKTTSGMLKISDPVNLERALSVGDRLGGHIVQGHVNGVGSIDKIERKDSMIGLSISLSRELMRYVIPEGSICIDGISLTVALADKVNNSIGLQIIPHSFDSTTLSYKSAGDKVNIETDMMGRYAEALLRPYEKPTLNKSKLIIWSY